MPLFYRHIKACLRYCFVNYIAVSLLALIVVTLFQLAKLIYKSPTVIIRCELTQVCKSGGTSIACLLMLKSFEIISLTPV